MSDFEIVIVPDAACPECGAFWGHEDDELNFPNRVKVTDEQGDWYRCYNPQCDAGYYTRDGDVELR